MILCFTFRIRLSGNDWRKQLALTRPVLRKSNWRSANCSTISNDTVQRHVPSACPLASHRSRRQTWPNLKVVSPRRSSTQRPRRRDRRRFERRLKNLSSGPLLNSVPEYKLPFDLMIGVNRRVYPEGVYQGQDLFDQRVSLIQYQELFNAFPQVTFPVSVLAQVSNQELVSYSWIFPNVVTNGHWWYSNIPAYIELDTKPACRRFLAISRSATTATCTSWNSPGPNSACTVNVLLGPGSRLCRRTKMDRRPGATAPVRRSFEVTSNRFSRSERFKDGKPVMSQPQFAAQPYSGIATFGRVPFADTPHGRDVSIVGIPY